MVKKPTYKIEREPDKKTDTIDCNFDSLLKMRDKPTKGRYFFGNTLIFTGNY
jgi:hypothetical protein